MKTVLKAYPFAFKTVFLLYRKLLRNVPIKQKTLREDRTAADKKHVAYCDPPQAENLACEILFYNRKLCLLKNFVFTKLTNFYEMIE